jgi:hypothetical protein
MSPYWNSQIGAFIDHTCRKFQKAKKKLGARAARYLDGIGGQNVGKGCRESKKKTIRLHSHHSRDSELENEHHACLIGLGRT